MLTPAFRWSLVVAVESLLVLFLLTFGNTFEGSIPLHRVHLVVLGGLGLAGWLMVLWRPSRLPRLLVVAPLPILATLLVTTLTSAYPSLGWYATWQCAAYVGIAWLLAMQAGHPDGRRNLIAAMGAVVTIVIVAYLAMVVLAWSEWLGLGFGITTLPLRPLGSGGLLLLPTWVSDVIVVATPVVAVSLWRSGGWGRVAAVALGLAAVVAMVITGTRSVLLISAVLVIVGVAMLIRSKGDRRLAAAATVVAVVVVAAGLAAVFVAGRSFDEGRSSAYASGVEQFTASPLVGGGPDTYGVRRMSDSVDALSHLAFPDAHNIFLTSAAESGLIGLAGLLLTIGLYVASIRRVWLASEVERPTVLAAVLGMAGIAGHAMGEVVFALIGVVLLVLAALALATTAPAADVPAEAAAPVRRRSWLDLGLVAGGLVFVVATAFLVRREDVLDRIAAADTEVTTAALPALDLARGVTDDSPETGPGWWVRMVAADRSADPADARESARRLSDLEGSPQQWLSRAVLAARAGDRAEALASVDQATLDRPSDPMVDLNVAILLQQLGDPRAAAAADRLLASMPDIEPALADGPAGLAAVVAAARPGAALGIIESDPERAFQIALSGEDRPLADRLLASVVGDAAVQTRWQSIVAAWFGDPAARAEVDAMATADRSFASMRWAWKVAARACDEAAAQHWGRALEIGAGTSPSVPVAIGAAPTVEIERHPSRYPGVVWRMDYPRHPYVTGIYSYRDGRPPCVGAAQ